MNWNEVKSLGTLLEDKAITTRISIMIRGRNISTIGGGGRGGNTSGRTSSAIVSNTINNIDINPKTLIISSIYAKIFNISVSCVTKNQPNVPI